MQLARIIIGDWHTDPERNEALWDAAESYYGAIIQNGQVYGDWLQAWSEDQLVAYTQLARPNALRKEFHSEWGRPRLRELTEMSGREPAVHILDDDYPKRFRSWRRSKTLFLFTFAGDIAASVCCGDTGEVVPHYLLPITDLERMDLFFWSESYRQHDRIWLDSRDLEMPAYKQLADPGSELSQRGRGHCAEIEKATGIPTYYYLDRYWGRREGETDRPCPLCGGAWVQSEDEGNAFHEFDFRCDMCRLVSNQAVSFEDERHARIGEYRPTKKD